MWRLAVPGSETPRSSPHSITRIKNYRNRCIDTPCPTSSPRVRQPWSWSMLAPRSPRGIKLHPPTVVTVHQYPSFLISLPQSLNRSPPKSAAFPEIFVSGSASGGPSHTHTHTHPCVSEPKHLPMVLPVCPQASSCVLNTDLRFINSESYLLKLRGNRSDFPV